MKKNWMKKLASLLLAGLCLVSSSACFGGTQAEIPDGPDYSKYTDQFEYMAYGGFSNGQFSSNGMILDVGESYITKERLQEYKDCGMQTILCGSETQVNDPYNVNDRNWLLALDLCEEVGLKAIVRDNTIRSLSEQTKPIVGAGLKFANEAELDAHIYSRMQHYFKHPAYAGIVLKDEPSDEIVMAGAYGAVYKSIERVSAAYGVNTCILANLMGMGSYNAYSNHKSKQHPELTRAEYCELLNITSTDEKGNELSDDAFYTKLEAAVASLRGDKREGMEWEIMRRRYSLKIDHFFEETGADYYMFDTYPLYESGPMDKMLLELQVVAEAAKRHGANVHYVTQALAYVPAGTTNNRILSEYDLRFLNNLGLGFGFDKISYFSYHTIEENASGDSMVDGSGFLTMYGEKTSVYYNLQKIMAENQKFAGTIKQFDYQTSRIYQGENCYYDDAYLRAARNYGKLEKVSKVEVNKEYVMVNELYDDVNDNYMYAVINVTDSMWQGSRSYQTAVLTFDEAYNYALVWRNGTCEKVRLEEGHKLTIKNNAGGAAFVIPY